MNKSTKLVGTGVTLIVGSLLSVAPVALGAGAQPAKVCLEDTSLGSCERSPPRRRCPAAAATRSRCTCRSSSAATPRTTPTTARSRSAVPRRRQGPPQLRPDHTGRLPRRHEPTAWVGTSRSDLVPHVGHRSGRRQRRWRRRYRRPNRCRAVHRGVPTGVTDEPIPRPSTRRRHAGQRSSSRPATARPAPSTN